MPLPRGFTLAELLLAVAVAGVLLALAMPAFAKLIDSTRARGAADRLHTELSLARQEALLRRRQVTLCRTVDHRQCVYSGPWSMGTMSFEDRNRNEQLDADDVLLRVTAAGDYAGLHVVDNGQRRHISFRPDGRSGGTNLTLRLCNRKLEPLRLLIINTGGRVRAMAPTPGTRACEAGAA